MSASNAFLRLDPRGPVGPVVVSVPHAGRALPPGMAELLALPPAMLAALEDRHVDLLVGDALAEGAPAIVARTARAWIDLNRAPDEIDPATMLGGSRPPREAIDRIRAGLGLVPRLVDGRPIWRRPLHPDEVEARLEQVHRPFHAALAALLTSAHRSHGVAVLMDCHSMPPLGIGGAQIVVGDRHGRSAAPCYADRVVAVARAAGLKVARNSPYAGGHVVARHGAPADGVHALQIEIDRRLYLEADLRTPSGGVIAMRRVVADIAGALADASRTRWSIAAE